MDDETLYRLAALQRFRRRSGRALIAAAVVLVLAIVLATVLISHAR